MLPVIVAGRSIADVQSDITQILKVDDASASVYVSLTAARLVSVQVTGAIGQPGGCGAGHTPVVEFCLLWGISAAGLGPHITLFQNGDRQIVDLYQSLLGLDAGVDPLVVNTHVCMSASAARWQLQDLLGAQRFLNWPLAKRNFQPGAVSLGKY